MPRLPHSATRPDVMLPNRTSRGPAEQFPNADAEPGLPGWISSGPLLRPTSLNDTRPSPTSTPGPRLIGKLVLLAICAWSLLFRGACCRASSVGRAAAWVSLDHLVGTQQESRRYIEAHSLGGLKVEDRLKLCRLLDRQVALSSRTNVPKSDPPFVHKHPPASPIPRACAPTH